MRCLIVGDVNPARLTALQSKGYVLVLKSKDDIELTGMRLDACIIDEQIKSTAQWELDRVNKLLDSLSQGNYGVSWEKRHDNMFTYIDELSDYPPKSKKKLKQKHQLPFWAANWRNK